MTKVVLKNEPNFDARIADAIESNDPLTSEFLLALYEELDEAVGVSDEIARTARAKSIDPLCRDAIAERGRAEDAEFVSHRLRNAATPLRAKYQETLAREAQDRWNNEAEGVRAQVSEAGANFKAVYTTNAAAIVTVFQAAAELDKLVDELNSRAPSGVVLLRHVEAVARGIPAVRDQPFVMQVKLPKLPSFETLGTAAPLAWPPPQPNFAVQYSEMVLASCVGGTPPLTDEQKIAASERQMAFYEQQERGREAKNAEAAARGE